MTAQRPRLVGPPEDESLALRSLLDLIVIRAKGPSQDRFKRLEARGLVSASPFKQAGYCLYMLTGRGRQVAEDAA